MNRITFFVLVLGIAWVSSERCITTEMCLNDTLVAAKVFETNFLDNGKISSKLTDKLKPVLKAFNKKVDEGPSECKWNKIQFSGNIVEDILLSCGGNLVNESREFKKFEKDTLKFPLGFYEKNTPEERPLYCSVLVPFIQFYCEQVWDNKRAVNTCDIDAKFDNLYRSKWEACKKNI